MILQFNRASKSFDNYKDLFMSLIECPECKKSISETVEKCPHCGYCLTPEKILELKTKAKSNSKQNKDAFRGFLTILVIAVIIISIIGTCSKDDKNNGKETQHNIEERNTQTLGVSYNQIMEGLDKIVYMEKSTDVDGQPRYMGLTSDRLIILEIIGNKKNVSQASIVFFMPKDIQGNDVRNAAVLLTLLVNIFPEWKSVDADISSPLERVLSTGEEAIIKEDKAIKLTFLKELSLLSVTIKQQKTDNREQKADSNEQKTDNNSPSSVIRPPSSALAPPKLTISDIIDRRRSWGPAFTNWYGKEAPDFTVTDLNGKKHTLSEYRGKNVMLIFWATWCPPCIAEIPHLIELRKQISEDKLVMLAISYIDPRNSTEAVRNFVTANPVINYPVTSTDEATMPKPYNFINSIPSSFFIAPDGKIKLATEGMVPFPQMKAIIEAER